MSPAPRLRPRRARLAHAVLALALLGACDPDTVMVAYDAEVGDTARYRAEIRTDVTRVLAGERTRDRQVDRIETTQEVLSSDDGETMVEVDVLPETGAPRTFVARLDRAGRLDTIDVVDGVSAGALGVDPGDGLPVGLLAPPPGELRPGQRWQIEEPFAVAALSEPLAVRGTGRVVSLGVEDGRDVAHVEVTVSMPVRSVVATSDGSVTVFGRQELSSKATYDLDGGGLVRERAVVDGEADLIVQPPPDVDAAPLRGTIAYTVTSETALLDAG